MMEEKEYIEIGTIKNEMFKEKALKTASYILSAVFSSYWFTLP
jgi:hypothetical protein